MLRRVCFPTAFTIIPGTGQAQVDVCRYFELKWRTGERAVRYDKDFGRARAAAMQSAKKNKADSPDFLLVKKADSQDFLLAVRKDVFAAMEKDESLKTALLGYYRENLDNLGFEINGH